MINERAITLSNLLRREGIIVSIRSSITASWLLNNYEQLQYNELKEALKCIYIKNKEDMPKFDKVFDDIFYPRKIKNQDQNTPTNDLTGEYDELDDEGSSKTTSIEEQNRENRKLIKERKKRKAVNDRLTGRSIELLDGYDKRVFDICQRLSRKIANQRSRRKKRQRSNDVNLSLTIRHNLKNGGHLINLVHSKPPIRKTKQIILSDVSGSCEWVSTWFFAIIYGCYKTFDHLTLYDFDNKIIDVTETLGKTFENAYQINRSHQQLGLKPYGQSDMTTAFNQFINTAQLNKHTDVIILTDCRDWKGEYVDGVLESATILRKMVQKSRRVIILNPEKKIRWNTPTSCVSEYESAGAEIYEACTLNQFADVIAKL